MKLIAALPLAIVASCTKPLPLEGHPCPCVPGYSCDERYQICVRDDAIPGDALVPDAAPVSCQSNDDCQQPPDVCSLPGTCNLGTHICVFGAVDCAAMTDGCNDGVCNPSVGCVKRPAREASDCGSGTTCTPFGSCDYTDVCDSSAVQSRVCSDNKCQSGTCTNSSRVEMLPCTRNTAGMPCGTTVFNNCSLCTGSSENGCASDGSQTCTCVAQICISDVCQPSTSTCQHACAQLDDGYICAIDPDSCGNGDLRLCCNVGFCGQPCGCIPR